MTERVTQGGSYVRRRNGSVELVARTAPAPTRSEQTPTEQPSQTRVAPSPSNRSKRKRDA